MSGVGDQLQSLMGKQTGAYVIVTLTAYYTIDLDLMKVLRAPRKLSAMHLFDGGEPMDLLAIIECTAGRPLVFTAYLPRAAALFIETSTSVVSAIDDVSDSRG